MQIRKGRAKEDPFAEEVVYNDNIIDRTAIGYFTRKISEEVGAHLCTHTAVIISAAAADGRYHTHDNHTHLTSHLHHSAL